MNFTEWLSEVKELFQNEQHDYHEVAEHYSFKSAFQDQMSPEKAVKDAIEWLET